MLNVQVPCFSSLYNLMWKINSKADFSHVGILQGGEDSQGANTHYSEALYNLPCLKKHDLKNKNIYRVVFFLCEISITWKSHSAVARTV